MADLMVIGSVNVDFAMKLPHLPTAGETVGDGQFMQAFGGKGANQAVAAARAGGAVLFAGCIGDDAIGATMRDHLQANDIDVRHVMQAAGIASGCALIMVDAAGQNYISVAPGANAHLTPDTLTALQDDLAQVDLLMLQYEIPAQTLLEAKRLAHNVNTPILFNYAPANPLPPDFFDGLAYLIVNETEAHTLCGILPADDTTRTQAANAMLAMGVQTVIITLGAQGAYVATVNNAHHIAAIPVTAVDATAAGDVFCGALAVAITEGQALPQAVRFANAAAAVCVTQFGAQPSIPARPAIESMLQKG